MSLDFTFPLLEIVMPVVAISILMLCCISLCKSCNQVQAGLQNQPNRPSLFVIPIPVVEEDYSPPPYSSINDFSTPPPYAEVEMKPDLFPFPEDLPPVYSEGSLQSPTPLPPPPPVPQICPSASPQAVNVSVSIGTHG